MQRLPKDLIQKIAHELPIKAIQNLYHTCRFFTSSPQFETLQEIEKEKIINQWEIVVGWSYTFLLDRESHRLYLIGNIGLNESSPIPQQIELPSNHKPSKIAAGYHHTLILCEGGHLYGFGRNDESQLGLLKSQVNLPQRINLSSQHDVPKQVVTSTDYTECFSLVLCENNYLYSFGTNNKGQLGLGDQINRHLPTLVPLPINMKIKKIIAGGAHSFLIDEYDEVYGFGDNSKGQLTFDEKIPYQLEPVRIPFEKYNVKLPVKLSAGDSHNLLLDANNKVFVWGSNCCLQLGKETTSVNFNFHEISLSHNDEPVEVIAASHSSYIRCKDKIYAFGDNRTGQLGLGNLETPLNPEAMPLKLQAQQQISIAASGAHTLILDKAEHLLYIIGENEYGQLGIDEYETQLTPIRINLLHDLQKRIDQEEEAQKKLKQEEKPILSRQHMSHSN